MTSTMTSKQFLGIFVYLIFLLGIASAAETYPDYAGKLFIHNSIKCFFLSIIELQKLS